MNIAFFTNNYKPFVGGVPIAIDNLAGALRRRKHRVHIFAPDYGEPIHGETDVFRTWSIKNFNDSSFALPIPLALDTYLAFTDIQADLVHVHHPFLLGTTGLHAARAEELPVVFTYHTQYEKYAHYLPWDSEMVQEMAVNVGTRFANSCDAVIAPSSDIKRMLEGRGVDVPIRVIPTGVDLQRFRTGNRRWLREKYNIGDDEQIVLFVSRLAKEKNVSFLLETFAQMQEERSNLRFVVVGSGDEAEALAAQSEALGCSDKVIFTGTLQHRDLISAFKSADLFVFASTTETQGMVVLEAMAAGCPVVAVDAPGVRDVVQNNSNGYLVAEGESAEFIRCCRLLLDDSRKLDEFRNAALQRAQELSLTKTTREVEDLYQYVVRNPHPERNERFLLVREFFRYQFNKLSETVASALAF